MKAMVIGFGKMGMLHAATLRMLPGIDEVIIAETSPLVQRAMHDFGPGMRIVSDFRDTLSDTSVTYAVIATPTASHGSIFRQLAPHMHGIFVEKPFASSLADAVSAAQSLPADRQTAIMIGHCLRFSAVFCEAKRLLEQGAIGGLDRFEGSMFSSDVLRPSTGWRSKSGAGAGGGVLLDLGSHLVDMARYLFGTPAKLTGSVRSLVSNGTEDAFSSEWFYSGITGKIEASWSRPDCRKATLEIRAYGSNGQLKTSDDAVEVDLRMPAAGLPAGVTRIPVTTLEQPVPFDLAGPMYTRQLTAWIDSMTGHPIQTNTLEENMINLRIIDAIRSSNNKKVDLT